MSSSRPAWREITTAPRVRPKLPGNPPQITQNSRIPAPSELMLTLRGVCGYEDSILARHLSTPSSGRLHVIRRWQRVLPHLRGTSRNMRDSGHNLPSGRFESHWYINDFLGTISPNPAITAKLPGDHHRPHGSAQNSREISTAPTNPSKTPTLSPPSATAGKASARRTGRYPHDGRDSKRVRCRPNSRTKEIRLPANQASAGPTSYRIRWSAALRMRRQHRAG